MTVICGKVLLVTVFSFQREFVVSDNPVNFLLAERTTELGPMLTDLFLSRAFILSYAYSIVLPVFLLQDYISSKPEQRMHLDPNTPGINSYYGLCASCTPVCFSATIKTLKTNRLTALAGHILTFVYVRLSWSGQEPTSQTILIRILDLQKYFVLTLHITFV